MSENRWHHLAFIGDGTSFKVHVDGISIGSETVFTIQAGAESLRINGGGSPIEGYMDEFRISKDIARWTSDFTVY
jgi:hypothetical protein